MFLERGNKENKIILEKSSYYMNEMWNTFEYFITKFCNIQYIDIDIKLSHLSFCIEKHNKSPMQILLNFIMHQIKVLIQKY